MNDPHVVALFYTIEHDKSVNYEKAKPLVRDEPEFRVKVKNKKVYFKLKGHYATEPEARQSVKEYIRIWELDAGLKRDPDFFKLKFDRAKIVDRNPTPGSVDAASITVKVTTSAATGTITPPDYPPPPSGLSIDADVQTMYERYMNYCRKREPLPSMAYFCLTILEGAAMAKTKGKFKKHEKRQAAAEYYHIEEKVLKLVGKLSSEKGDPLEARKREGPDDDLEKKERRFKEQERRFLEEAVKKMIYRAAEEIKVEKTNNPTKNLCQITLSDLPSV
ncbi:MAG: hypothetical protein OXG87_15960 [Gemmatimonadetes bacterium]|nr:hypothetical protein [Gemmatimonadota bacterium]